MKKKVVWLVAVLVIIAVVMVAVLTDGKKEKKEAVETGKLQIGMSFDSFVIERWLRDRDVFVSTAKELGAEVNVQNANGDIEEQKKQIDYFIEKGMDAIVIISVDSYGLRDQVKKAQDAGIKVVAYDRLITEADVDLYISFDNSRVGDMMGETLVRNGIRGGKVLMLGGSLRDSNVPLVEGAFKDVMRENEVSLLYSFHADNWEAELAAQYVHEHLDVVAKADAIMCGNDNLATQVVRALSERRMAGNILVVGQDADLEACQRIVEGTQLMTVYKPVEKLAQRAAECTIQLIKEDKVTGEDVETMDDGRYEVPYVAIEPISVTDANIDEVIIDSGFHLKEDIYLNVPGKMPK
ncbi:MAG: substrate-binding domain-containing protein [Eubacterium sp.]|nr:substrate-binding domain-containing protein [Eubacterium sp.]